MWMRTQSTGALSLDKKLSSEYTCARNVGLTWWGLNVLNRSTFTSNDDSATFFRDNHCASRFLVFISVFIIQIKASVVVGF